MERSELGLGLGLGAGPGACAVSVATLLVGALVFTAGCMNVGRDFPTDPVGRLVIGETTQSEVRTWFGEPWRTGVEDGRLTWTYGRYHYSAFSQPRTRDLVLRFERGVLASYTFNSTAPDDVPDLE